MTNFQNQNILKYLAYIKASASLLFLSFILFLGSFAAHAQSPSESSVTNKVWVNDEYMAQFELPEVYVIPAYKFNNKKQRKRYTRLAKHLIKVYPYAKMASEALIKLNDEMDSIADKKLIKKHIKQVDRQLQEQYGNELKKLTITQGRLLIKLIDRETGSTSYELVKELKGSFSAFMWQSLARLFGENLKDEYNPKEEDRMIEHIVLLIENNQL